MLSRIDGIVLSLRGSKQHARASRLAIWDKKQDMGIFQIENHPTMRGSGMLIPNTYIETFGNWIQYGTFPGVYDFFFAAYHTPCEPCAREGEIRCLGHLQKHYQVSYKEGKKKLLPLLKQDKSIQRIHILFEDFPLFGYKRAKHDVTFIDVLWHLE